MGKQYAPEERHEAVKLAGEIRTRAASERLGINIDTMYTWISKARQRSKMVRAVVQEKGSEGPGKSCRGESHPNEGELHGHHQHPLSGSRPV